MIHADDPICGCAALPVKALQDALPL